MTLSRKTTFAMAPHMNPKQFLFLEDSKNSKNVPWNIPEGMKTKMRPKIEQMQANAGIIKAIRKGSSTMHDIISKIMIIVPKNNSIN